MIRLLEELSLNAWPALQTLVVDGWVVRFANGYTRRANSVNPLYSPQGDPMDNIAACEALFAARGLPVIFKLTPASQPAGLDDLLAARGYAHDAETSVQTLDLRGDKRAAPGASSLSPTLNEYWLAAVFNLSQLAEHKRPLLRQMLSLLAPPACFATVVDGRHVVAAGLAVAERGHVGFFDIVTHPAHRRQGHARRLMLDLLAWGQSHGAHTAYLQVMCNNAAALALYAGLGFAEQYRYWYRVKGVY
jgi:ribosomal protein S18 acetylase RimI-like enzyme